MRLDPVLFIIQARVEVWTGQGQWKVCCVIPFHNAVNFDVFLIWKMCSLSEKMCSHVFLIWKIFTYFRSWFSNANQSVQELCNMALDQIVNVFVTTMYFKITMCIKSLWSSQIVICLYGFINGVFQSAEKIWLIEGNPSNGPILGTGLVRNCY